MVRVYFGENSQVLEFLYISVLGKTIPLTNLL